MPQPSRPRLTFVTREGCTICAEALEHFQKAVRRSRVSLDVVDVDADPVLKDAFGGRVPVVLGEAGDVVTEGRIGRSEARAVVTAARRGLGRGRKADEPPRT